ncbi:MAG: TlpA family protein disulfide reductase [Chitinophagaceae bacterium]|nr:TlpA family protein disulfide reductase [Chitinophagaceae bacterium]MCB9045196.1 TlpA family protein disulfide reductase [Chitinophagales bacterium]
MKKLLVLALSVCVSTAVMAQNTDLPDTQIKDVTTNKKVAFNSTFESGKVTLVNFWATWCVPCKKEIKIVRKNLDEWKKEVDFNYMTVSVDEARAESLVRSYAKSQGWDFPYYIDPNSDLMRSLNFRTVPFTIIVDGKGKVVYTHQGYSQGGENELFAKIKEFSKK